MSGLITKLLFALTINNTEIQIHSSWCLRICYQRNHSEIEFYEFKENLQYTMDARATGNIKLYLFNKRGQVIIRRQIINPPAAPMITDVKCKFLNFSSEAHFRR